MSKKVEYHAVPVWESHFGGLPTAEDILIKMSEDNWQFIGMTPADKTAVSCEYHKPMYLYFRRDADVELPAEG